MALGEFLVESHLRTHLSRGLNCPACDAHPLAPHRRSARNDQASVEPASSTAACSRLGCPASAPPTPPTPHRDQRQQLHTPRVPDVPVDRAPRVPAERRPRENQPARGDADGHAVGEPAPQQIPRTEPDPDHGDSRETGDDEAERQHADARNDGGDAPRLSRFRRRRTSSDRQPRQQGEHRQQRKAAEQPDAVRRVRGELERDDPASTRGNDPPLLPPVDPNDGQRDAVGRVRRPSRVDALGHDENPRRRRRRHVNRATIGRPLARQTRKSLLRRVTQRPTETPAARRRRRTRVRG